MSIRVYELAKRCGVPAREILQKLNERQYPVRSSSGVVDRETADIIEGEYEHVPENHLRGIVVKGQVDGASQEQYYVKTELSGKGIQLIPIESLKNPEQSLWDGNRVSFRPGLGEDGIVAQDVALLERRLKFTEETGIVRNLTTEKGFGVVQLHDDGRIALFRFSDLLTTDQPPAIGSVVSFQMEKKFIRGEWKLEVSNVATVTGDQKHTKTKREPDAVVSLDTLFSPSPASESDVAEALRSVQTSLTVPAPTMPVVTPYSVLEPRLQTAGIESGRDVVKEARFEYTPSNSELQIIIPDAATQI